MSGSLEVAPHRKVGSAMTDQPSPDHERQEKGPGTSYSLHGDEIETRYDDYILKLKQAVKILKTSTASNQMRPMDHDNPIDAPGGYDI